MGQKCINKSTSPVNKMILTILKQNNHWLIKQKTENELEKRGKAKHIPHSNSISIFLDTDEALIKFKKSDNLLLGTLSHKEMKMQFTINPNTSIDYFYWKKQNEQEKFLVIKTLNNISTVKNSGKPIAQLTKKSQNNFQLKISDSSIPSIQILGSVFPILL